VQFYDQVDDLATSAGRFLAHGLRGDGACLVVAAAAHRAAFATALVGMGIDLAEARADGAYLELDADALLSRFLVRDLPDPAMFLDVVGGPIATATVRGPVWVYGEMVGVLWDRGRRSAAIALEGLWGELLTRYQFGLFCAYPLAAMDPTDDLTDAKAVCDAHGDVLAPPRYAGGTPPTQRMGEDGERSHFFVPVMPATRAAREFVADTLAEWGADDLVEAAALVTSELAANALMHARSPFRVSVIRGSSGVKVCVRDACVASPTRTPNSSRRPGGRGLAIVAALSHRWGSEPAAGGKVVWAEIEATPALADRTLHS
jgi:hypothetical protein